MFWSHIYKYTGVYSESPWW